MPPCGQAGPHIIEDEVGQIMAVTAKTQPVHAYIDSHRDEYLTDLKAFLSIPSISTLSQHKADMQRAAQFVQAQLRAAGMEHLRLIDMGGAPLVYGDWLHAEGKPTILIYGHYDVQPVDPLKEW